VLEYLVYHLRPYGMVHDDHSSSDKGLGKPDNEERDMSEKNSDTS